MTEVNLPVDPTSERFIRSQQDAYWTAQSRLDAATLYCGSLIGDQVALKQRKILLYMFYKTHGRMADFWTAVKVARFWRDNPKHAPKI